MKVELIAYTPEPDYVCAVASQTCVWHNIPKGGNVAKGSLKHALASGHESVAEHASFTFAVSGVSRALTHQLVRHRVASYSQQSQRYVRMEDFDIVTPQSIKENEEAWDDYVSFVQYVRDLYDVFVNDYNIPEEDARYILPNACCTNIVVTMNARELRHFFRLRCCSRAQWEIREMANLMLEQVKEVAPILFKDAGASCVATGRCPEGKKSCGRVKE